MRPSGRQSAAVSSTPQRPHGGAGVLEPMPLRYVRTYGLFGTHLGHYVTALAASTRRRACACPENSFTAQCRLKRQSINSNAIMIGGSHACTKPWRSGAQQRSQARLPRQVRNLPRHATRILGSPPTQQQLQKHDGVRRTSCVQRRAYAAGRSLLRVAASHRHPRGPKVRRWCVRTCAYLGRKNAQMAQ